MPDEPELHPLAQAAIDAHERLAPKMAEAGHARVVNLLEQLEDDLRPIIGPVVQRVLDDPELSAEMRALLAEAADPGHAFGSLIVGFAIGSAVGPVIGAALAPEIEVIARNAWAANQSRTLTPDLLAALAIKGISLTGNHQLGDPALAGEAAFSGINQSRFAAMTLAAGNSIGFDQALLLDRRGQLVGVTLDDVLGYSNVNPRFYASAKNLRYDSPSVGAVLAGAVQGHLDDRDPQKLYVEAGGNPDNYEWQYQTAGRPPAAEQMLHLLNRRLMTEDEVRAAIRESDIKNKYIQAIIDSRVYLPPPRSVVPQLRHHSIDEATARKFLSDYGVTPEAQDAFIKEASSTRTTAERHVTAMQVIDAYEEHLIDRPTAITRIESLNYSAADATMLLDLADAKQTDRAISSALTRIRGLYVGYRATRADTVTSLAGLNVPNADQAQLLAVWDHERSANAPDLTVAQWQGALRRDVIRQDQFATAMTAKGYNDFQITVLAAEAFPPPPVRGGQTVKVLTPAQDLKLYSAGSLSLTETRARLVALGYSPDQANELISLAAPPPTTP